MNEEKKTCCSSISQADKDAHGPAPAVPEASESPLETLLLDAMRGIGSSAGELRSSGEAPPVLAEQYRSLSARLSFLEESFARICNLLGRLDQEVQILKNSRDER